jgi:hypothetical protein
MRKTPARKIKRAALIAREVKSRISAKVLVITSPSVIAAFLRSLNEVGAVDRHLPTDHANFVHQQNEYGRQRDPSGGSVASEEVRDNAYPASASSYQSTADIGHSGWRRKTRTMSALKPDDLT